VDVKKKIAQIGKGSGQSFRVNLDSLSLQQLQELSEYHREYSTPASRSVLLRRAVRLYRDHITDLTTDIDRNQEATELFRAAKGC